MPSFEVQQGFELQLFVKSADLSHIAIHVSQPEHFGALIPATRKRCRTLYGIGEMFLSRFAYPSAMYSNQTESKQTREMLKAFRCFDIQREYLAKRHTRTMYKGKLTTRYRRILDKEGRFNPNALRNFSDRFKCRNSRRLNVY
jgi:hypothetical protein